MSIGPGLRRSFGQDEFHVIEALIGNASPLNRKLTPKIEYTPVFPHFSLP